MKPIHALLGLSVASVLLTSCTQTEPPPSPTPVSNLTANIDFKSFYALGYPEQDVFMPSARGAKDGWRMEIVQLEEPAMMAEKLKRGVWTAAEPVAQDPFKTKDDAMGPVRVGKALNMTLTAWANAHGRGKYTVQDGTATVKVSFDSLIPRGTYSLWCVRLKQPPEPKFFYKPCGAADGSQNGFEPDGKGRHKLELSFPALPDTSAQTGSLLAVIYHSDGQRHGAEPGAFGKDAHVQLLYEIPEPRELKRVY